MYINPKLYTAATLAILDFLYGSKIDAWDADTRAEIINEIVSIIRRVVSQAAP